MILPVLKINETHSIYKDKNLIFDYITEEQFTELEKRGEEVYGEINLLKPYEKECLQNSQTRNVDVVLIPDRNGDYEKAFEIFKAKKSHRKKSIGYITVKVQNTFRYVRVVDCKSMVPFLLLFIGIMLVGLFLIPQLNDIGNYNIKPQPTFSVADGEDWNGELPERFQGETDYQESIEIAGYTNLLVTDEHKQIDLINTDRNTVYQRYKVYLDSKELFDSQLIAPGKMVVWNAYEDLEAGHYIIDT